MGAQGPHGDQGPQGLQGAQGLQGDTGLKGDRGLAGSDGPTGPRGPTGSAGVSCPASDPACHGPQGPTGASGPNATALRLDSVAAEILPFGVTAGTKHHLVDLGPFSASYECFVGEQFADLRLDIDSPSTGAFQSLWVETINDRSTDDPNTGLDETPRNASTGGSIPAVVAVDEVPVAAGEYGRAAGTAMVYTPTQLWQVTYHLYLDARNGAAVRCSIWGAATPTS